MEKLSLRAIIGAAPIQQVAKTHEVWGQYGQTMQNIFDHCHHELSHQGPLKIDLSKDKMSFSVVDASGKKLSIQDVRDYDEILADLNRILDYLNRSKGASSSSSSSMPQGERMRDLEELQWRTQAQLQQLTAQVGRTVQESEGVRRERDQLHRELDQVRRELADLRAAQTASASPHEPPLREEREAFLSSLRSIVVDLQQGREGVAEQIERLLTEQKSSNQEVIGLLRQILACLQKGEGSQSELFELNRRLAIATEKMGGDFGTFRASIEESRDRIERLEAEVAKLRGMPGLSEQLQRNHQEMLEAVRGLHGAVVAGLGDRQAQNELLMRLNATIDDLGRQIGELNAKIGAMQLTTTFVEEKAAQREEEPKPTSSASEPGPVYSPEHLKKLANSWMGRGHVLRIDELLRLQRLRLADVKRLENATQESKKAELQKAQSELETIPKVIGDLIRVHAYEILQSVNNVEAAAKILGITNTAELEAIRTTTPPNTSAIVTAAGELIKPIAKGSSPVVKDKAAVSREIRRYFSGES